MSNGAELLAKAKTHWREKLVAPMESVAVSEWDTVIFFKPTTLAQRNTIFRYVNDGSLESLVQTLIIRALDEDGRRLFSNADKKDLMEKVDPDIIVNVINAMNEERETTIEDARKNSEAATKKSS
jgi:LytS/YehU family sensor histidine kinase